MEIKDCLIGELIGLARATEGNEHLISESTTNILLESLSATEPAQMAQLLEKVQEEKRKMVPNCFSCASPCGRTNAFDLSLLAAEEPEIQEGKYQILEALRRLAENSHRISVENEHHIYEALIVVGIEAFPYENLQAILLELKSI